MYIKDINNKISPIENGIQPRIILKKEDIYAYIPLE